MGVLRGATGTPGLEYERQPEPMQGGFWAELLSFSLANPPGGWPAELVARLMPDPGAARKETIVQRAVARTAAWAGRSWSWTGPPAGRPCPGSTAW